MLDGEGPLLTIAQIAMTLAGFSSVVIALRGSSQHDWSAQDRVGLGNVMAASVGTLFGSLLPFPLAYLGWSNDLVWAIANAVFAALLLTAVSLLTYAAIKRGAPPRAPRTFWSFIVSGFVTGAALALSAFDVGLPRGPSLLLAALLWVLLAAFAQLVTFLMVTWSGSP
jgi:hypothetical protein